MTTYDNAPADVESAEGAKVAGLAKLKHSTTKTPGPNFLPEELQAMHGWCCGYRDMVHLGIKPAPEQDHRFTRWSRVCYRYGVVYGR
mgnify:CR=1 FL=1